MHCNSTQCLARATVFGVFINTIHTNCIHGIAPLRQYWMLTKCSPWLEAPTYCLTLNDTFLCVSASVFIIVQLQLANENGLTILTSSTHTHTLRGGTAVNMRLQTKQHHPHSIPTNSSQQHNTQWGENTTTHQQFIMSTEMYHKMTPARTTNRMMMCEAYITV